MPGCSATWLDAASGCRGRPLSLSPVLLLLLVAVTLELTGRTDGTFILRSKDSADGKVQARKFKLNAEPGERMGEPSRARRARRQKPPARRIGHKRQRGHGALAGDQTDQKGSEHSGSSTSNG